MPDIPGTPAGDERELLRDMAERATLLYWNSDRSVNSIADDLGLSKGKLYELIRPLASGEDCPNCQSELIFENRTARDRGQPACPVCDELAVPAAVGGRGPGGSAGGRSPVHGTAAAKASGSPSGPIESGGVVAGFLLGTVAGVLLSRFFRR